MSAPAAVEKFILSCFIHARLMPLRILFVPFGSEGDVNPLFWLAEGLAARGHEPVFLLSPHYGHHATRRGFRWIPIGSEEDFHRFARHPLVWDRLRGPFIVVQGMVETLTAYRKAFAQAGRPIDLVVTSSIALGAATMAEARKIPRLTLHLQPLCLRSEYDCPLILPELAWLSPSPRWVKRLFFRLTDLMLWRLAQRPLNVFRAKLRLPPLKRFYEEAVHGGEGIAALFPDWYAPPQPDWPSHLRQFGFPLHTAPPQPLPPDVENFLAAGPPPVVWTHGSANFDIRHFQTRALAVSRELGLRCLLVSLDPPAESLPDGAFHTAHVRFEDLFPRCAAAVHHGGIGTTAKAIASGVPQLIIPRSHDQPDNAARIVRLGLGHTLSYGKLDTPALAQSLGNLLASRHITSRCLEFKARMQSTDPLPALCDWAVAIATTARKMSKLSRP